MVCQEKSLQEQQSHLNLLKSLMAKHCRPHHEPFQQPGLRRVVDAASLPSSASLDASLTASCDAKHDLEEGSCLPPCTGAVQWLECRCRKQITQISSSHDGRMGLEELLDSSALPSLTVARLQESISPASHTPFALEHSSGPARGVGLPRSPPAHGCRMHVAGTHCNSGQPCTQPVPLNHVKLLVWAASLEKSITRELSSSSPPGGEAEISIARCNITAACSYIILLFYILPRYLLSHSRVRLPRGGSPTAQ